jgi:diketogulonate reductase-like aldo/keto reductase
VSYEKPFLLQGVSILSPFQPLVQNYLIAILHDQLSMITHFRWDYSNKYYYDAIDHLMHYQQEDKIRYLGLTNFDTEHLEDLLDEGAPIVSNQVAYSLIDTRPQKKMAALCKERNVKLLCYGTLLVSTAMCLYSIYRDVCRG